MEQSYLQSEKSDNGIPLQPKLRENDSVISELKVNPMLPVDLITISVQVKRKRNSVFSQLNVQPSFKKLKMEYLLGDKKNLTGIHFLLKPLCTHQSHYKMKPIFTNVNHNKVKLI